MPITQIKKMPYLKTHFEENVLQELMKTRGGGFANAFTEMTVVRTAVNQVHVELSHPLDNGDEVAFFPPVTGGGA